MAIGSVAQNKINAEIILKLDSLNTGIADANAKIKKFTDNTTKQSQDGAKATAAAWKAGFLIISVAAIKMARAVTNTFKDMVSTYADFEQSLANTQSVARASTEELDAMEAAARRVGATTRSTASEAANALYFLASAGFSATESIGALDGVNALAIATQSDLASTSETVATTIRQYGLETDAATDIANTFTAAITNSLATMNKLAKSFEYVGPIAAGLGITVEETTGALELLYNKGFSGEKAGRGLRSILVDLADSTSVVTRKLGKLNIAFADVNPATNKLADIFDTLRENGVNAANAAAIFGKVSGVQLASLISVASDAEGGMIELTESVTGTTRAFEAMDIQMNTLQGSIDKFRNAEEALEISVGKQLSPTLRVLVDTITGILLAVNKAPESFLAAGSVFITLAAVVTTLTVAFTALKLAMASAVIAPVIAALAAIALPATIAVGAVAALTAGLIALNNAGIDKAVDQFGSIAEEMGATGTEVEKVSIRLSNLSSELLKMGQLGVSSTKLFREEVKRLAEVYGLTEKQVIDLAMANKELIKTSGDLVIEILLQVEAEEKLAKAERDRWLQAYALTEFEKESRNRSTAYYQRRLAQIKAEGEATEGLETAFKRSVELQKLFGDEFDQSAYLVDIYNKSLKTLVNQGVKSQDKGMLDQIELFDTLQEKYNIVIDLSKEDLTDKEKIIAAQSRLASRLKENVQLEIFAKEKGEVYNKTLEDRQALIDTINGLLGEEFEYEGADIQQILDKYPEIALLMEEKLTLTQEYQDKLLELTETELEKIDREEAAAIIKAGTDAEAIIAIKAYNKELRANLDLDQAQIDLAGEYEEKLKALDYDAGDRVNAERKNATDSLKLQRDRGKITDEVYKETLIAIDAYYDELEKREAGWFVKSTDMLDTYGNLAIDVVDSVLDYQRAAADEEIRILEKKALKAQGIRDDELAANLADIDKELQAALVAAGVQEKTEREQLEASLEAARVANDYLKEQDLITAIARYDISQDYLDRKEAAQDAYDTATSNAADELADKISDINYDQAKNEWELGRLSILLNGAVATMKAWSAGPYGWAIAAGMAGVTAFQYAAATKAEPVREQFADGGIVPGSSYKGDSTDVSANAGELILNRAQQDTVYDQMTQDDQPIYITIQTVLDGRVVATNSAKYYRNGQVKI